MITVLFNNIWISVKIIHRAMNKTAHKVTSLTCIDLTITTQSTGPPSQLECNL